MYPELLRIGDFSISSFGLMLVFAFLAAYFQLRWGLKAQGVGDDDDAASLVFAAGFFGIVGAKVYYAILEGDPSMLFSRSGLVWYGGFLLAVVAVLWTMRLRKLPWWPTIDAMSLGLALGYAVGRIGCFLVGDDWGVPTDKPWGVVFPEGAMPPSDAYHLRQFGVPVDPSIPDGQLLAVHPTQLYETFAALVIWVLGVRLLKKRLPPGVVGMAVLAMMAVERLLVEFLRAKDDRFLGMFTIAQLISVGVLVVALALLARRRRAAAPS